MAINGKDTNSAFERLMKERPNSNNYDSGSNGVTAFCRSCRFHRPNWKYQTCVYAKCPYSKSVVSTKRKRGKK